jgi:Chromosome segregation protein Spc25
MNMERKAKNLSKLGSGLDVITMTDFCLTTNLRLELEKTNQSFERWADRQDEFLSSSSTTFQRQMEECDCTIKALKENDTQLDEAKILHETIKQQQKAELSSIMEQLDKLRVHQRVLEEQCLRVDEEERNEMKRLDQTREEYEITRQRTEQSMNDLTFGIRQYMHLGLEFLKVAGERMKFVYTQIDPSDHKREFSFQMFVDERDIYQLVETSPQIQPAVARAILQQFNDDNDIGRFVLSIRKEFKKMVASR